MKKLLWAMMLTVLCNYAIADDSSRGCGVGSLAAPKKSLVSTTTATVIDFFVPSQIFATTSGTSGCAKHDLVLLNKMQKHYVAGHLEKIKFDAALGSGEALSVLARTMGCGDNAIENFGQKVQANFETLESKNADGFLSNVKEIVKKDQNLKAVCPLAV